MQIAPSHTAASKVCTMYCRRGHVREKLAPARVTCWTATAQPRTVTTIEADSRGARLVLPFKVKVGEVIRVSFADHLGQHQTRTARVAWTHRFHAANHTMVGVAFQEEMAAA